MNTYQERVSEVFIDHFDRDHRPLYAFKYYSPQLHIWLKHKPMNYVCAQKYRAEMVNELGSNYIFESSH